MKTYQVYNLDVLEGEYGWEIGNTVPTQEVSLSPELRGLKIVKHLQHQGFIDTRIPPEYLKVQGDQGQFYIVDTDTDFPLLQLRSL